MFSGLLSFLFAASSITLGDLPPERVETIAQEVISELAGHAPKSPELVVTRRPEPTPLGAIRYRGGRCKLVINITDSAWSQWSRFLHKENQQDWDNIIRASVAHEIGHCLPEHGAQMAHIELSENALNALSQIEHTHSDRHEHILRQELFADTVAILYAREFLAEAQADKVVHAIIAARDQFGRNEPTHNTAAELRELVKSGVAREQGETLGQAAIRVLAAL
ncbi:MAG: hypothetical protein R3194_02240 [Limnobacter sp.]|nr:hypothetical protein [Limnobacter sp.]